MQQVTLPCKHSGFGFEEFRTGLTLDALADLQAAFEPISFDRNAIIFNAQDIADRVLLVKTGCVTVDNGHSQHHNEIMSQADGRVFGLLEVLAGSPHGMALKAATAIEGWVLPANKTVQLLRDHPQLCLRVVTLIASIYNESIPHLT